MEINDFNFLVHQKQGIAILHYGYYPYKMMTLKYGNQTIYFQSTHFWLENGIA